MNYTYTQPTSMYLYGERMHTLGQILVNIVFEFNVDKRTYSQRNLVRDACKRSFWAQAKGESKFPKNV